MQPLAKRLTTARSRPWPSHPIPIALVITDLDVGGAERILTTLATRIDRRRWLPSVLALGPEGELVAPLRKAGIDTECLNVDPRRPIQAVARLAKALRMRRPQLVQSFLFHANVATRLAAPWAGSPWVVGGLRVAEREKGWHLRLDRASAWLSAGSVCVSEGVLRFSREVGHIDPGRLTVIPNGIDPSPYDDALPLPRAALGVPEEGQVVLYVGRLEAQKAPSVLLDAAEVVAAAVPNWHMVMVGDGPERAALQRRCQANAILSERVHWLGPRGDVPSLLKTADLLVLPSLWEGMPNVVLEAMAAGRAVVASAVEGSEDLVVPNQTGWLVPARSSSALAHALLEAASDSEQVIRLGEGGRQRVGAQFTLSRMVEAYEALWAGLLGLEQKFSNFDLTRDLFPIDSSAKSGKVQGL